ncbi:MAG: HesA/MoeB/ThiF family protein [Deltaproteobacteria bacterium]|nr:HesA/MoeB/ThiF family protein [Deltaproteobacteria bacterium]
MTDATEDRPGPSLSPGELERYRRQIIIPGIGERGQGRLKAARVCVIGLGGLGSISATYLAAAGIGYLRGVDCDCVEPGNLNRQVLHWTPDLGRPKAESAREKLSALNPEVETETVRLEVTPETVGEAVGGCRLIVDATDNLATRRVLNRFAVEQGIPFVFGGVEGFGGMVLTVVPGDSPCLECLFPARDRSGEREIGVAGPVPGVVASLQALEVIKLILGLGSPLLGRLLLFRGLDMTFRELRVDRNPDCPVCGPARRKR